jgi:hypothetical protein
LRVGTSREEVVEREELGGGKGRTKEKQKAESRKQKWET